MENNTNASGGLFEGLRQNAGWAIAVGILMVIAGILAIGSPLIPGLAITVMVGILLLISGVGECVLAFRAGAFGRGLLIFLLGLVTIMAGFYLVSQPVAGLASITLFLALYFLISGILTVIASFQLRPESGWGAMLFNGIVTVVLGFMIYSQWPLSGIWAVGVLFGVRLLMGGFSLSMIGSAVRGVAKAVD